MKIFFLVLFIVHGLIHLLGFTKAFNLAQVNQFTENISKPAGLLWLLAAILFIVASILYYYEEEAFWIIGAAAVIVSQVLIISYWNDAKYGTIANVILLVPIIIAFAGNLPGSYKNLFQSEVEKGLKRYSPQKILTENDIKHLPLPVQNYIIYTGAIGKEKIHNFRLEFSGQIKPNPESDYLNMHAIQYSFYDEPTRLFYLKSKKFGLPFDALHLYVGSNATMQVKVASLFQVVDARGAEMNKSETVTMFNDMCIFAPSALIDKNIEWETIDSLTVKAKFTNQGNTITALLFFNETGELINFSSKDRYESADGKAYKNYEWETPLKNYKDFNGRKLASYGEAIWHKPEGNFYYAKFNVISVKYNCTE